MTNKALQTALDTSMGYCAEYRKVIENRDCTIAELDQQVATQRERIQDLERMLAERTGQLERFAEAYRKLKPNLQFYEAQIKKTTEEHYQLRKQYETGLEEHRKALSKTFKELSARYEANAKQEIAKAVASVKANEQSAEEICRRFATGLLNDFERALPKASTGSATPSSRSAKR